MRNCEPTALLTFRAFVSFHHIEVFDELLHDGAERVNQMTNCDSEFFLM